MSELRQLTCDDCEGAGFCTVHKMRKFAHWTKLCRANQQYRDAYDAGRGPGQNLKVFHPTQLLRCPVVNGRCIHIKKTDTGLGIYCDLDLIRAPEIKSDGCSSSKRRRAVAILASRNDGRREYYKECSGRFSEITTRHLLYHIYASKANDIWLRNIWQLKKRRNLFNGRCVFAVAIDSSCHSNEVVQRELDWPNAEWLFIKNNSQLREAATFLPLLTSLNTTDSSSAFFYAHTKGNSNPCTSEGENPQGIVYWRNALYHHLLDKWASIETALRWNAIVTGCKMVWNDSGTPFPSHFQPKHKWMGAGTFWWIRCDQIFSRSWKSVPSDRYGIEGYPGMLFEPSESASVYQPWPDETRWYNPYDPLVHPDKINDRPMRIGLDLDGTIYAAPNFFRRLIDEETAAGNRIVCSSGHSQQDWRADIPRLAALGIDAKKIDASLLRDASESVTRQQKARILETCDWAYDDDADGLQSLTKTPIRKPPW